MLFISSVFAIPGNNDATNDTGTLVQACISVDLGPDTMICQLSNTINKVLTGPTGVIYEWSTGETSQSITITTPGTYILKTYQPGTTNFIVNGDFSAGNTGFNTGYIYTPGVVFSGGGGRYDIVRDGSNNDWADQFTDHTDGTGNYMFIDGNSIAGIKVWQQSIKVIPNTEYIFSAWVRNLSPWGDVQPELNFDINGVNIGGLYDVFADPDPDGYKWNQFYTTWNSGSDTSITISIEDNVVTGRYNDFAIDDIEFRINTCSSSDTIVIKLGKPPVITLSKSAPVCQGTSVQLHADGAGVGGTYTWDADPTLSATNIAAPEAKPIVTTTYTVTGIAANGCKSTIASTLIVNPLPIVTAPDYITICKGGSVTLSGEGTLTYEWDNSVSNGVSFNPDSTTTYTVTGTDANNCKNTAQTTVKVDQTKAQPVAIITPIPALTGFSSFYLNGSASTPQLSIDPDITYTWSVISGGKITDAKNMATTSAVANELTSEYQLEISVNTIFGTTCSSIDTVTVEVKIPLVFPNVFSPNGDNVHDFFDIRNSEYFSNATLEVFNQWGSLVYVKTGGYSAHWDGRSNGHDLSVGTYYYIFSPNRTGYDAVTGPVSIIR